MRDFRELAVWAKAHQLALSVYTTTAMFPRQEQYGLASQLQRSGSSIPTNIAEGCGTDGNVEFARFLEISMRSATELEYQLVLVRDLGYIDSDDYGPLSAKTSEVKRMLASLIRKVRPNRRS